MLAGESHRRTGDARGTGDQRGEALATLAEYLWLGLMALSLKFLEAVCPSHQKVRICTLSAHEGQRRALVRLQERAQYFVHGGLPGRAGKEVPRTPKEPWPERLKGRRLDYEGNVVTSPMPLVAAQLRPGLPPPAPEAVWTVWASWAKAIWRGP